LGASYKDNVLGISYINYGGIQGYNDFGTATHEFTPFDFSLSLGRKFGSLGLLIKTFGEKIDDQTLWGVGCGMSSFLDLGNVAVGAKIDNLGKEFLQDAKIPLLTAFGLKFTLPKNTTIFIEFKAPDWEINAGLLYCYQYITLLSGTKYIMPKDLITNNTITGSFSELDFCGGIVIQVENYKIGYSFVYTKFSNAHQFSITFTPERSRRGEG
jgi:hypothetical protein